MRQLYTLRTIDTEGEPVTMDVIISNFDIVRSALVEGYVRYRMTAAIDREIVGNLGAVTWPG